MVCVTSQSFQSSGNPRGDDVSAPWISAAGFVRYWNGAGQSVADAHQSYLWTGRPLAACMISGSGSAPLISPAALPSRIRGSKIGFRTGSGRLLDMAR